jgi:hypothetical protein
VVAGESIPVQYRVQPYVESLLPDDARRSSVSGSGDIAGPVIELNFL